MSTKRRNHAFVTRRLRRALNNSESPPMQAGRKLVRCGYGQGANQRDIDAATPYSESDYAEWENNWLEFWGFATTEDMQRSLNDEDDWKQYAKCAA